MNRKKILWLVAALLPTTLLGKGEVAYTRLQSFYSNAGMVGIDKVVLSDTATVMYCTAKGKINAWFQFSPSTYLSDEEDARYPREGGCRVGVGREMLYSESRAVGVPSVLRTDAEGHEDIRPDRRNGQGYVPHLWHPRSQDQGEDSKAKEVMDAEETSEKCSERKGRGARQDRGIFTGLE